MTQTIIYELLYAHKTQPEPAIKEVIITVSKRELITPEQKPSPNIQEVVVANLLEPTTTSKQPQLPPLKKKA